MKLIQQMQAHGVLQNVPTLARFDKDVESPEMKIVIDVVYVYYVLITMPLSKNRNTVLPISCETSESCSSNHM